jgi:uncharacterized membrane protein
VKVKHLVLIIFLLILVRENLFGQLYFKNEAPYTVWVAVGYYIPSTGDWISKGWYKLDDNSTTNVLDYNLSYNRYYYYYAYDLDGNYWAGGDCNNCTFWINNKDKFELNTASRLSGDQYESKKFKQIDTQGYSSYTLTLTGDNWCVGNCQNGYGTYKWVKDSKKYVGYWRNGQRWGQGTCEYGKYHKSFSGAKFVGEWANNTWKSGTFTWADGSNYQGSYVNEKRNGRGILNYADGSRYEGYWKDDEEHGEGKMYWAKQDKTYQGNWVNGSREGRGSSIYGSGHPSLANCKYEGTWENNTWKKGTLYYADGSRYVGEFSEIKRHGQGILYDSRGNAIKSGEWVNDRLAFSNQSKPDITWDAPVLSQTEVSQSSFRLKACIQAQGELSSLKIFVNNQEISADRGWSVEDNCTRYINQEVPLRQGENVVYISASNSQGTTRSTSRTITYRGSRPIPAPVASAKYYALLIGVNDYQDLSINDLQNPINDTEKLKRVLSQRYQFESQNIYHLKNPTKRDIISQLETLQRKLREDDYLLIFYSGHGKMQNEEGYWLPADAQQNSSYLWLSSSELNTHVKQFASRHVLLIADACYSGAFVMRDIDDLPNAADNVACEILENKMSRCAMTSGAKSTVPDNSVFLKYLLKQLEENPYSCVSAEQIYMEIKEPVISNSPNNHIPQFGDIPRTGHEGGNFIFKKR